MFAYCQNNPANYFDPSGNAGLMTCHADADILFGGGLGFLGIGGGGGVGGAVGGAVVVGLGILAGILIEGISLTAQHSATNILKTEEKAEAKAEAIPAPPPSQTVIYRYYASKTENLSPRKGVDYDGLSFSTKPPRPGVSAVVTTIEQVNATGILLAIPTGGLHVTIIPTNGTVSQWMAQGQSSIWSQTLSLIVIEWNEGSQNGRKYR